MAATETEKMASAGASSKEMSSETPWKLSSSFDYFVMLKSAALSRETDWSKALERVFSFDTLEQFWSVQNNIIDASQFQAGDYSIFKSGSKPSWDDAIYNSEHKGGRWQARIPGQPEPGRSDGKDLIEDIWLTVVLGLILNFYESDSVQGVTISRRKNEFKLALWMSDAREEKAKPVGEKFQKLLVSMLSDRRDAAVVFQDFEDQPNKLYDLR
uniref:Eukaryotic translation initiation factor 4E n=1 Tax=Chromera velia CCMP2878 TaxID=1169474 RepID=A0A0G4GV75_9ALVE|mmetsp:Transcript_18102/g.36716  ORF Transcript_18102/g.36716 Transcript_18102/m.36716 type:complete len:213 (-) Transcript_18102:527-1165(-)|eukprot:Cvel_23519.t1-p1 / transcript=Cvel_23519.t1 / gene=Cvel_23519 / organism=Chromera_velia_CCMP2878 / gene_product=Eukaryotic translation initiation factor 4E, putative / transcript_product=Eukaryotic translation initiation factor 4E, putative / location=Cvel_scaffold2433:1659-5141(+) / protein_length=212 / sequence_SO=supercontig / SO=protein_coding / is_pseudo=false